MDNKQWIFGRHPVLEALQAGQAIEKVYLQQGTRGDFEKELRRICRSQEIPLTVIPKEKINWMVKGNHQGVVALQGVAVYQKLENILPLRTDETGQFKNAFKWRARQDLNPRPPGSKPGALSS